MSDTPRDHAAALAERLLIIVYSHTSRVPDAQIRAAVVQVVDDVIAAAVEQAVPLVLDQVHLARLDGLSAAGIAPSGPTNADVIAREDPQFGKWWRRQKGER